MAEISIMPFEDIERAARWDAEYYQPKYLANETKLTHISGNKLEKIAEIVFGTTPEGGEFEEVGIPFIRSQNFSNHLVSTDHVFCDPEFHKAHLNSKCVKNDLLFGAVGATIGEFALVPNWIEEANTNQNIARIRIQDSKYSPEYIWSFFLTDYGQFQLKRHQTGNAQPYLNTYRFKQLYIPYISSQQRFIEIVKKIQSGIAQANRVYPEAEAELLERMGWAKLARKQVELSHVEKFEDIQKQGRYDAEHFQPQYKRLQKHLEKIGGSKIENVCYFIKHGVQPPYVDDGTIPIVTQRQFTLSGLDMNAIDHWTSQSFINDNPWFLLRKGDVLTYCVSAGIYLGQTNVYLDEVPAVAASFVTILRTKKINPVYLSLFLNSPAGTLQSNSLKRGTSPFYLYPRDLSKVLIFIPQNKNGSIDLEWQKKLADKVIQASKAKSEAQAMLDKAKKTVEDLIILHH